MANKHKKEMDGIEIFCAMFLGAIFLMGAGHAVYLAASFITPTQ